MTKTTDFNNTITPAALIREAISKAYVANRATLTDAELREFGKLAATAYDAMTAYRLTRNTENA